jgi:hypothetical protein
LDVQIHARLYHVLVTGVHEHAQVTNIRVVALEVHLDLDSEALRSETLEREPARP